MQTLSYDEAQREVAAYFASAGIPILDPIKLTQEDLAHALKDRDPSDNYKLYIKADGDKVLYYEFGGQNRRGSIKLSGQLPRFDAEQVTVDITLEKKRYVVVSEILQAQLPTLTKASANHPFLERKGLSGDGLFQLNPGEGIPIPARYQELFKNKDGSTQEFICLNTEEQPILLIPQIDINGTVWGLQRIYAEKNANGKDKFYLKGARHSEVFSLVGQFPRDNSLEFNLYLAESWADGMSVHLVMGCTVVCCGGIDNYEKVLLKLKKKFKDFKINYIILANNDAQKFKDIGTNPGVEAAKKLAETYPDVAYISPNISNQMDCNVDWSDLYIKDPTLIKDQIKTPMYSNAKRPDLRYLHLATAAQRELEQKKIKHQYLQITKGFKKEFPNSDALLKQFGYSTKQQIQAFNKNISNILIPPKSLVLPIYALHSKEVVGLWIFPASQTPFILPNTPIRELYATPFKGPEIGWVSQELKSQQIFLCVSFLNAWAVQQVKTESLVYACHNNENLKNVARYLKTHGYNFTIVAEYNENVEYYTQNYAGFSIVKPTGSTQGDELYDTLIKAPTIEEGLAQIRTALENTQELPVHFRDLKIADLALESRSEAINSFENDNNFSQLSINDVVQQNKQSNQNNGPHITRIVYDEVCKDVKSLFKDTTTNKRMAQMASGQLVEISSAPVATLCHEFSEKYSEYGTPLSPSDLKVVETYLNNKAESNAKKVNHGIQRKPFYYHIALKDEKVLSLKPDKMQVLPKEGLWRCEGVWEASHFTTTKSLVSRETICKLWNINSLNLTKIIAWFFKFLIGDHQIFLYVTGIRGSGKSTLVDWILKCLVFFVYRQLALTERNIMDVTTHANISPVLFFDNLKDCIKQDIQSDLAGILTGSCVSTRMLYKQGIDYTFNDPITMIATGINNAMNRTDMADRVINVNTLGTIEDESDRTSIDEKQVQYVADIRITVLTWFTKYLKYLQDQKRNLPHGCRKADWSRMCSDIHKALNWEDIDWQAHVQEDSLIELENHDLYEPIVRLLKKDNQFEGTMFELLCKLQSNNPDDNNLKKMIPNTLSAQLTVLEPVLKQHLDIVIEKRRKSHLRTIKLYFNSSKDKDDNIIPYKSKTVLGTPSNITKENKKNVIEEF